MEILKALEIKIRPIDVEEEDQTDEIQFSYDLIEYS
jgi:hypothetical protein